MAHFWNILFVTALVLAFGRLCLAQLGWMWKIAINSVGGFLSLWLLNLISGYTGILFPINFVTACVAGFLGIPGIAVLAVLQIWV